MTADLISRLPMPLAQAYLRARNSKSAVERHQHAYFLLEATVKFMACVGIQAYLAEGERAEKVEEALRPFGSPSLGHWVQALRAVAGHFGARMDVPAHPFSDWSRKLSKRTRELGRFFEFTIKIGRADGVRVHMADSLSPLDLFNFLPSYRNKHLGHGAVALESFYAEFGRLLLHVAEESLTYLEPIPLGGELVLADEKREIGEGLAAVERLCLMGGLPFRCEPLEVSPDKAGAWHAGRLYAVWPNSRRSFGLDPLLRGTWVDEVAEVYFFNGIHRGDIPEYLSYHSGKTLRGEKGDEGLEAFLGCRTGQEPGQALPVAELCPPTELEEGAAEGPDPTAGFTEALDRLEAEVEALGSACSGRAPDTDSILRALTRFQSDSHELLLDLRRAFEGGGGAATLQALLLSLRHLAERSERLIQEAAVAGEGHSALAGFLAWLQKSLHAPAASLFQEMEKEISQREVERDFFWVQEERLEFGLPEPGDWVEDLASPDDLRRHEAMITLSDGGMETFLRHLKSCPSPDRDLLLEAVWGRADLLLVEARGRSAAVFEAAVECAAGDRLREKWNYLYFLFRKVGGAYWDPDLVRLSLEDKFRDDRRTFCRCFLLHPWEPYRRLALETLEPRDFWEVITAPETPVSWLLAIWRSLKPRVPLDFLKVFLVCSRDALCRPGGPERALASLELVKEFYQVDVFHEDAYFKTLGEIDEALRAEGKRHRLLVDLDREYVERFQEFHDRKAYQDQPVGNWSEVPLPIQRRLANRGYFLKHFACHPNDRIAMECLRHLLIMESVIEFLSVPSINGRLLVEMSKEKRLFQREEARCALVCNPKTPSYVVLKHIGYLRKDNLRRLSENREGNQFSRQFALKLLARNP